MTERVPGAFDHLKKKSKPRVQKQGMPLMYKAMMIVIFLFVGLLFSGILVDKPSHNMDYDQESQELWEAEAPRGVDMVMYADPNCGCCHLYVDYLQDYGFSTRTEYPTNLIDIKNYQGIPKDTRSCHTIKFGEYFIEGHIPIEVIQELVSIQPDIDGIALAGMPAGSPGMDGEKNQDWEILSIKNGQIMGTFMII